jgi:lipopolysaccharide transport system ATP-binding protein
MLYGISDIARGFLGFVNNTQRLRKGEFWALKDISIQVRQGEVLGVIGPNGSGKSTLLKLINGIFYPDEGMIEVNGKVGALIEVGAGFHPLLTGRENIYVNGAILGMTKREIDKKFDDIVDFADIGDFIDKPVKYYSSGMFVRLGFSTAVHCEPDILLVDEVLAVGDVAFRLRCFNYIKKLVKERQTSVVFVTHNLSEIVRVCNNCIVMNKGKLIYAGNVHEAIRHYQKIMHIDNNVVFKRGNSLFHLLEVLTLNSDENKKSKFTSGDDIVLEIKYKSNFDAENSIFLIKLVSQEIGQFASFTNLVKKHRIPIRKGIGTVRVKLYDLHLLSGTYAIEVHVYDQDKKTFWDQMVPACTFEITEPHPEIWEEYHVIRINHEWLN